MLCNNNEIYGLTGGQTGPTTPTGTKTLSSPAGNPNTPINLQGLVRSSPHALYAKTTVYHQIHMRNVIREAIEHPGFSFVDITSQCIENNGRRIGFASANDMLTFYRKTYKRAPKDATELARFEIGVLYPDGHATNGTNGAAAVAPAAPAAAPEPAKAKPAVDDEEKARRRAESQKRLALMQRLDPEVKLRVAKGELTLADALREAGIDPESGRMTTRIALDGVGGQGVRVIAGVLGALLARMGKQVTVLFDYDSSVRGSMSDAFVIFDDHPIANPVVEEADIMLKLADKGHLRIHGRKVVTDLGLGGSGRRADPVRVARLGALRQGALRQHDRAGTAAAPGGDRLRRGGDPRLAAAPLPGRERGRDPLRLRAHRRGDRAPGGRRRRRAGSR